MKKSDALLPILNDTVYSELLHQAVAEIRTARNSVAKHVNTATNSVLLEFG